MIHFFRKIRLKLLNEYRIKKYLFYALGEMILVTTGILIALQVNNWNDQQNNDKIEVIYLNNISAELQLSLMELKSDYEDNSKYLRSTLNILTYLRTKPELVDSMYSDFYNSVSFNYFFPNKTTYETLKNGELKLIKSDSLRSLITDIYESGYQRVIEKINTRRNAARLLFPYYQKNFVTKNGLHSEDAFYKSIMNQDYTNLGSTKKINNYGIPINYDHLLNDPEYETLINEALVGRIMIVQNLKSTILLVENCIAQIDKYLMKYQTENFEL